MKTCPECNNTLAQDVYYRNWCGHRYGKYYAFYPIKDNHHDHAVVYLSSAVGDNGRYGGDTPPVLDMRLPSVKLDEDRIDKLLILL